MRTTPTSSVSQCVSRPDGVLPCEGGHFPANEDPVTGGHGSRKRGHTRFDEIVHLLWDGLSRPRGLPFSSHKTLKGVVDVHRSPPGSPTPVSEDRGRSRQYQRQKWCFRDPDTSSGRGPLNLCTTTREGSGIYMRPTVGRGSRTEDRVDLSH